MKSCSLGPKFSPRSPSLFHLAATHKGTEYLQNHLLKNTHPYLHKFYEDEENERFYQKRDVKYILYIQAISLISISA